MSQRPEARILETFHAVTDGAQRYYERAVAAAAGQPYAAQLDAEYWARRLRDAIWKAADAIRKHDLDALGFRPATFDQVDIGQRVILYSFGEWFGTVAELNPIVSWQGRSFAAIGWIKVQLDDGREWNGQPDNALISDNAL